MKILFINEYYPPHLGGVEVVLQNLAQGLVKLGHEVDVVTCRLPGTAAYEESEGVNIHRVRVPKKGDRYWFNFLCLPTAWKLAKGCDIVHAGGHLSAFPSWLIAKSLRKKSIVVVHGPLSGAMWRSLGMNFFSAKAHQILERILVALPFDKHICVSRCTRNCVASMRVKGGKLEVIYNGLDYDLFSPEKANGRQVRKRLNLEGKFVYMCSGRPVPLKGGQYLVEAVPLISEKIPNSKLMLIVTHEPKDGYENIKKSIRELGVENSVCLLDPVPGREMPDYIAAADCVIVPSLFEAFGYTAAEACAMGKPVVASKVGSLPEVVSGKYVLIEPRSPQAIAEAVSMIYNNEVKDTAKKIFSWDESVMRYLEVYKAVISSYNGVNCCHQ